MRLTNVCIGCLLAGASIALAACGGGAGHSHQDRRPAGSRVVDIYSSLPMRGPAAAEAVGLVDGIRLAVAEDGYRAGRWKVIYTPLDDSGPGGGWDAGQTAANARRVAVDRRAVYYIGEFDSAASQISIPVLNQADLPQVSPTNTNIGLTTDLPGARPGEPKAYYPTGTRTFLRLMPTDTVQAGALLLAMQQAGCTRVAVADDGSTSGAGLATLLAKERSDYRPQIVYDTPVSANAVAVRGYAQTIRLLGADCFVYAGVDVGAAAQLTREVNAALPTARIFGSDGICSGAWTDPLSTSIDPLIECTAPTLRLSAYPGGDAFLAQYEARYGTSDPNVYAIYGYEAMKLGLDTVTRLGPNGDSRSAIRAALFGTRDRHSVLGPYGFDPNGDTTLRLYGLYRVGLGGNPEFLRTLAPPAKSLP